MDSKKEPKQGDVIELGDVPFEKVVFEIIGQESRGTFWTADVEAGIGNVQCCQVKRSGQGLFATWSEAPVFGNRENILPADTKVRVVDIID